MANNQDRLQEIRVVLEEISKVGNFDDAEIKKLLPASIMQRQGTKRFQSDIAGIILEQQQKRHYGRIKAGIILGAIIEGREFLEHLEAMGILLPGRRVEKKFTAWLTQMKAELAGVQHEALRYLESRLATYISFCRILVSVQQEIIALEHILANRSQTLIRSILALTELYFLYAHFNLGRLIKSESIARLLSVADRPESFASIVSHIIARANELKAINPIELMEDIDEAIHSDEVVLSLRLGVILHRISEISKAISLFGYDFVQIDSHGKSVYKLVHPVIDFEYYQKLGYIREEMVRPLHFFHTAEEREEEKEEPVSLNEFAKLLLQEMESLLTEWKYDPYPRLRLNFPVIEGKHFLADIVNHYFFEDSVYLELLKHEYLMPMEIIHDIRLSPSLDITTFMNMRKCVLIEALLCVWAMALYDDKYNKMSYNSLIKAKGTDDSIKSLSYFGFGEEPIGEFLQLISWNIGLEPFYDIQYTPIIKVKDHSILLPAVFITSNLLRNTQISNKIRLRDQGNNFTTACSRLLETHFNHVLTDKEVRQGTTSTDIDIVILNGDTLYLFECKYSIPPCSYHEMRDIWRDIDKGAKQLTTAMKILADPKRRQSYWAGWFPGASAQRTPNLVIKPCILNSHRIFAGMSLSGIPVRDFQSFVTLLMDLPISNSSLDFDVREVTKTRYSVLLQSEFSHKDLDEYLSEDSKYFRMFKEGMNPITFVDELVPGKVKVAQETYQYTTLRNRTTEEFIKEMNRLGFRRLPDERKMMTFPLEFDEMKKRWDLKHK